MSLVREPNTGMWRAVCDLITCGWFYRHRDRVEAAQHDLDHWTEHTREEGR